MSKIYRVLYREVQLVSGEQVSLHLTVFALEEAEIGW